MKESSRNDDRERFIQKVSTNWLEEHLKDQNLMIIDTQPDIHDYIAAHIPTAIYLNQNLFRVSDNGMPSAYAPDEVIQSIFRRIGLVHDKNAIVYSGKGSFKSTGDGLEQTMVAYTLARFGHNKVCIVDGGIDKWESEKKPLSQVFPQFGNTEYIIQPQEKYTVTMEQVKDLKDKDNVLLLDARPTNFYEGTSGPWIRNGHIPGAINVPWKLFMDETNPYLLKPESKITTILDDYDIIKDKMIICSCGTGREATAEFILLKWYLGYSNVKLYEGSFTEWSAYPSNPIASSNPVSERQRIM